MILPKLMLHIFNRINGIIYEKRYKKSHDKRHNSEDHLYTAVLKYKEIIKMTLIFNLYATTCNHNDIYFNSHHTIPNKCIGLDMIYLPFFILISRSFLLSLHPIECNDNSLILHKTLKILSEFIAKYFFDFM